LVEENIKIKTQNGIELEERDAKIEKLTAEIGKEEYNTRENPMSQIGSQIGSKLKPREIEPEIEGDI
jgi:hypothetical protein